MMSKPILYDSKKVFLFLLYVLCFFVFKNICNKMYKRYD